MTDIMPFIGTRFNSRSIGNLSKVLAPPYDVVSPEYQNELYKRHENNVIRLELNKTTDSDDNFNNRYTRSANFLRLWRSESVLIEDETPALYLYEQEFKLPDGTVKRRRGFYAAVKLEDYKSGGIRAHEQTFAGPKADRLNLMRATGANFSPIFVIYKDPKAEISAMLAEVMSKKVWEEVTDDDGVIHRLWVVQHVGYIAQVRELMAAKDLFIADGHHRFETALNYRDEMREKTGLRDGKQPFDYMMMYLTNAEQDGMVILPTHRVLSREIMDDVDLPEALAELKAHFKFEPAGKVDLTKAGTDGAAVIEKLVKLGAKRKTAFAMVQSNGDLTYMTLKNGVKPTALVGDDAVDEMICKLDVTILHHYIISQVMIGNPDFDLETEVDCFYIRDVKRAFDLLKSKKCTLAFLMNTPDMGQVMDVVQQGLKMPHKSTFFFPKIITGFVLRNMSLQ